MENQSIYHGRLSGPSVPVTKAELCQCHPSVCEGSYVQNRSVRRFRCQVRTAYTNGSCCAAPIAFKKAIRVRKEGGGRQRKEGRQQGGEATSNEQRAEPPSHQQQRATSKPPATSRASEPPSRAEQTKRPSRSGKECVHTLRRFAPHRWSSRRLRSSAAAWGPSPMPYTINGEWDPCKARVIHRVRCVDA